MTGAAIEITARGADRRCGTRKVRLRPGPSLPVQDARFEMAVNTISGPRPGSGARSALNSTSVPSLPDVTAELPPVQGLYDPAQGKGSAGVGFIADIKGRKSHKIVEDALSILCNLEHRGAVGADPRAGDGAGILVQIPHAFFSAAAGKLGFRLPAPGEYAVGALFMPRDPDC